MFKTAVMDTLPNEIIEYILTDSCLGIVDIVNFSSTCSKFREVVNTSRSLWKAKYFQRWPETDVEIVCEDWYNECISRRHFEKQVLELLSTMSSKFFHLDMKNIGSLQLDFTVYLINLNKYGYYYLRDFLIAVNSLPLTQSLTNKYYGNLLLKYIHKRHCKKVWNNLIQLSSQEQTLEKGAIFVTLWCQEYERGIWKTVTSELDAISSKVKHHLLQNFPNHPFQNTPEEGCTMWKNKNIPGNMFEPEDCKSIIWAINYTLFEVLKFCVTYDFNDMDRRRCGIDHALLDRKASPIIFAVIFESIARRLGVKIEILEFLDHCLLRWKEDYREKKTLQSSLDEFFYKLEDSPIHYISTSTGGIFLKSRCPRKSNSNTVISPCNMQQIAQRAALYIYPRELGESHFSLRDALELMLVIKPFSLDCYQQLSRSYMLHEMDAKELISKLKDIKSQISVVEWRRFQPLLHSLELYQQTWERNHNVDHSQTLIAQRRVEDIDFAVGMIVRDKFWELTGVIHGWNLSGGIPQGNHPNSRQVFYKVLVDDGSYQYAPQENLQILHSPPFISHPSIGRFFDEYCMTYYKPNKELQAEYPQDMEALQQILKKDRQT